MHEKYDDGQGEREQITSQSFDVMQEPLFLELGGYPITVQAVPFFTANTATRNVFVIDENYSGYDPRHGALHLRDGETILVGRSVHHYVFDFPEEVSGRHVQLKRDGDMVEVTDLGSTNGTVVVRNKQNGENTIDLNTSATADPNKIGFTIVGAVSAAHEHHPHRNEDAYFVDQHRGIAGVFDGVGGQVGSEIAARIAANVCSEQLSNLNGMSTVVLMQNEIKKIMVNASREIEQDPAEGISTTATITKHYVAENGKKYLTVANIGDSRAYLLRNNALHMLTIDNDANRDVPYMMPLEVQQKLGEVISKSDLPDDLKKAFENRHYITACLGEYFDESQISLNTYEVFEGELIVLLTDGITDNTTTTEIEKTCIMPLTNQEKAQKLIDDSQKRSRGSHDRAKADDMTAVITSL